MPSQINNIIRKAKTTVLIVGEGPKDKAFIRHLKDTYVTREDDIAVKVDCGAGGSPRCVVEKAIRLRDSGAYDRCIVIVDEDRKLYTDSKLKKRMREKPPVEINWIKPCMEGLLLQILEHHNFSRYKASAAFCKHEFACYIPVDKQTESTAYIPLFTKVKFDICRKGIRDLDIILKIMQK